MRPFKRTRIELPQLGKYRELKIRSAKHVDSALIVRGSYRRSRNRLSRSGAVDCLPTGATADLQLTDDLLSGKLLLVSSTNSPYIEAVIADESGIS